MAEYKNVGNHAEDLAGGQMYAPGETFELDDEAVKDEFNKDKIDRGIFILVDQSSSAVNATDGAVEVAKAHKVNLAEVAGTGASGRITQGDVENHIAEAADKKESK